MNIRTGRISSLDGPTTVRTNEYIAFWMDSPLCNFTPCHTEFEYQKLKWPNSEAAFMYGKARTFRDDWSSNQIYMRAQSPGNCKQLGRGVKNFDEQLWTSERQNVMFDVLWSKFNADEVLKQYLIKTGDRLIIEASIPDRIWGNGLDTFDPRNADPKQWKGLNLLGDVLMTVRKELTK